MKRNIILATSLAFVILGSIITILYAKGYRFDSKEPQLQPTGILVATSDPDGAQVYINSHFTTATNNTINLSPGEYDVRIQKDGYAPWQKKIIIKKEEVYKTNAFLFPTIPDLRPITFTGAKNPVLSPDGQKIAFVVPLKESSASAQPNNLITKVGIWVLDMGTASLPFSNNLRQIAKSLALDYSSSILEWSADSRQILAAMNNNHYLLDDNKSNDNPKDITPTLDLTRKEWRDENKIQSDALLLKFPESIKNIATSSAINVSYSPDGTKILYTATASATIPQFITLPPLGANPTKEERTLKPNTTYVYDLKEDKNFFIREEPKIDKPIKDSLSPSTLSWFPSSRHLLSIEKNKIQIIEYDGTNTSTVYSGNFENHSVFAYPNWGKLIILTNLNQTPDIPANLYSINLR